MSYTKIIYERPDGDKLGGICSRCYEDTSSQFGIKKHPLTVLYHRAYCADCYPKVVSVLEADYKAMLIICRQRLGEPYYKKEQNCKRAAAQHALQCLRNYEDRTD